MLHRQTDLWKRYIHFIYHHWDCDNHVMLNNIYIDTDIVKVCSMRGKNIMRKNKVVNRIGKIMVAVVVSTIFLLGCASSGGAEYRQVDMNEVVEMMENEKDYIILDVRTKKEFEEQHIPDAINVPNETIGKEEISELPDKEQLIMVYCRSGNRSKQASEKLVKIGYSNIVEFGGIKDWSGETVSGK